MVEWHEWEWWNDPFFELRIKIWTSLVQHRQADKVYEIYRGNQGQLESFRIYKRFSIIFPKILDAILRFTKVIIFFPNSFLHRILESENCRFPFSTKNSLLNLGSEMQKIKT